MGGRSDDTVEVVKGVRLKAKKEAVKYWGAKKGVRWCWYAKKGVKY